MCLHKYRNTHIQILQVHAEKINRMNPILCFSVLVINVCKITTIQLQKHDSAIKLQLKFKLKSKILAI